MTPGLSRSSQSLIPFGLPLDHDGHDGAERNSLWAPEFQLASTSPASTSGSASGSTEKFTKSAAAPAATLRDWSPDAP